MRLNPFPKHTTDTSDAPPKKKRRRWPWVLAGLFAFFVLVGACGGDAEQTADDAPEQAQEQTAEPTAAPEPEPTQEPEPEPTAEPTVEATEEAIEPTPAPADPLAAAEVAADVEGLGITREGDVLFAKFPIGDNLTSGLITTGAQLDTVEVLRAVEGNVTDYSRVFVQGEFPMTDAYGKTETKIILNAGYPKETVDQINFDGVAYDRIWDLMDSGMVHPELRAE